MSSLHSRYKKKIKYRAIKSLNFFEFVIFSLFPRWGVSSSHDAILGYTNLLGVISHMTTYVRYDIYI